MSGRQPHDQRLKTLLKEFFAEFVACFPPIWAARLGFTKVQWLDTEVLLAPPTGEKRRLDLVGKLGLRLGSPPLAADEDDPQPGVTVALHVEIESGKSMAPLRSRMFEYYVELRRRNQLPVLPIALFLRAEGGIGWETYRETVWEHLVLDFNYAAIGLADLPARDYATGENLVGAALSSLMRASPEERALLHAEALRRIAAATLTDRQRFVLTECLEAYSDLDATQRQTLEQYLNTPTFAEARPLMITTFEKGLAAGKTEGLLCGERDSVLRLLAVKFGPLDENVRLAVEAMTLEQVIQLQLDAIRAQRIEDCLPALLGGNEPA